MKITIIIPAYNEEKTIKNIVHQACESLPQVQKEIIIVNDGSTDKTDKIIKEKLLNSYQNIKYITLPRNRGKGVAIRKALEHATGSVVIIQDADLEYDPCEYLNLITPILSGKTKIVYGSRMLGTQQPKTAHPIYLLGGIFLTKLFNVLYKTQLTDLSTGYKVFDTNALKGLRLNCRGFEFCAEVTAKLARLEYAIEEVPICYSPRTVQEGKKIKITDSLIIILTIITNKFCPIKTFLKNS